MVKCVFSSTTKRGVALNREAGDSEFMVLIAKEDYLFFNKEPSRYAYIDGTFAEAAEWAAEQQALADLAAAEKARVDEITEANETSVFKTITLAQANAYINTEIGSITDLSTETKTILADILRKIAVRIL